MLKEKFSLLELEKHSTELKDRELRDSRKVRIKREIEDLFFEPIIEPIDDLGKFE